LYSGYSRKKLISIGLLAFMIGSAFGGALWGFGGVYIEFFRDTWNLDPLQKFSSYNELQTFLNKSTSAYMYYRTVGTGLPDSVLTNSFAAMSEDSSKVSDFSTTNIQVAGVDEADIVKTDGQYIYIVSETFVYIVQAYPPSQARVLSKLSFNQTVTGIFIASNRLAVFHGASQVVELSLINRLYPQPSRYTAWTTIKIYDTSDKSDPILRKEITVDGYYFTSRMIGDYVYTLFSQPIYITNGEISLPTINIDGQTMRVPATSIYYINSTDYYYGYVKIIAFNIQNTAQEPASQTLLIGSLSNVYVSQNNLYLALPGKNGGTNIHMIAIKDGRIAYGANGTVPGTVLNQFSMDEYDGYFRIATTSGWPQTSNVYVMNERLRVVGSLQGLAPGESIHAARFMGERCYLVTFKKTDPLFVIDIKYPTNPTVLGQLKIPGYSDYLQPYDETHLIGIGKETIESEQGDFAWYQGVKVSLFDVSNVSAPRETAKVEIGDRGTDSQVLRDAKALLFSRSRNLLVLPVLVAEIDASQYPEGIPPYAYGNYVWQGVYVYNITAETGFTLLGTITQMNAANSSNTGFSASSPYTIERSLYIGNVLYTLSDRMIKMNDIDSLEQIGAIQLL